MAKQPKPGATENTNNANCHYDNKQVDKDGNVISNVSATGNFATVASVASGMSKKRIAELGRQLGANVQFDMSFSATGPDGIVNTVQLGCGPRGPSGPQAPE